MAILATPGFKFRGGYTRMMSLSAPKIGAAQINPAALPGAFEEAAKSLVQWMSSTSWASTPLEARLQVGLIALGERPENVALRLEALARKMIAQLTRRPPLAMAVHRLLLARRSLPRDQIAAVSGVEPAWQPLLESCIGYGDDEIRVSEVTRQVLLDAFEASPTLSGGVHYLAYNLERSGGSLASVRSGYAAAAAAEPDNPWWQQRWIRFLIAHGTLAEAHAAWQHAVRAIDPDGSRLRRSPWLALNLHCWVARRWLALGRVEEARMVLSEVPEQWLREEPLRELLELIAVQEQELVLGESVYPDGIPVSVRWKEPRSLRLLRAGRPLVWWAPGRVLEALPDAVTVALAPTPEEVQQLTFEAPHWQAMAGELAEDAQGFFEIGMYEGGERVVRPMPDAWSRSSLDFEEAELRARVGR